MLSGPGPGGRVRLVPFPTRLRRLFLADRAALADVLGLRLAPAWPNPNFVEVIGLIADQTSTDDWVFFIVLDGEVVGEMGAKDPPGPNGEVEIGYGVVPAARRRGVTSAAVAEFLTLARARGVRVVDAQCLVDNVGSIGVLERSGFVRVGTAVDDDGPLIVWQRRLV